MNYIQSLSNTKSCTVEKVGGKGANLAKLIEWGFPVPDGFVVIAQAYRDAVGQPSGTNTRGVDLALPASLTDELTEWLKYYPTDQAFAVRSSGTLEDLDGAAFAGLHDTFLNVHGRDRILERILDCYQSLWSTRAVAYREKRGFDHQQAAMAVVVQTFVPCERAGVAFTVNPINGDLKELIIDANYGLGESVVSGASEVDHFVMDKEHRVVKNMRMAANKMKVIPTVYGTQETPVNGSEAMEPCLGGKELATIASEALKIEAAFGFPQDIEWGFARGRFHVLQSRSITSIAPRWTRDESAERYPKPITPLTWDFVDAGFHRSLKYSFRLMGFPAFDGKWFASHDHYIYGNQNAVELYGRRAPFKIQSIDELEAALPHIRDSYRWVQELPVKWGRNLDNHLLQIGKFQAENLDTLNVQETWEHVLRVNEHGTRYFLPNIAISITQSQLYHQLRHLMSVALGPEIATRLFADLTGYCETKTGGINMELYELAQMIRENTELQNLIQAESSRSILESAQLNRFTIFRDRFVEFLRDHGHREVEFDAYHPTWVDAPWVVLDNLKHLLQNENLEDPAKKERKLKVQMQRAEKELLELLPPKLHYFFFELLRLTREYTRLDDLEHYHTTRLTVLVRRGLLVLGDRLRTRGILDESLDIFFAHDHQITAALEKDYEATWKNFTDQVRIQKAAYLKDAARTPDWILGETAAPAKTSDSLDGIPGSGGQAEGPVYHVNGADDFATFPQGAVLIARTTNPSWTPMFYSASAVITESGGPLSHGAVTAREMGIPAVMAVRGVMDRFENGQRVRVDGTHGLVCAV